MDFGAFPPEFNSARMYAGPGSGSLLAAAAAWNALAADLRSAGSAYGSLVSGLASGPWLGPSSTAMSAAAAPYVMWLNNAAEQAEQASAQATAAAGAYQTAFAMTVPPPVVAANQAQELALTATNFFGQNSPAIAATHASYLEMWAQDATAMYGYAGNSAAASRLTAFTPPPHTVNPAGATGQTAAVTQATGTSAGTAQASLTQQITQLLQSLASPGSTTTGGAGLPAAAQSGSGTITTITPAGTPSVTPTSGISFDAIATSAAASYASLPGFFGMFMGANALGPLMGTPMSLAFQSAAANAANAAAAPLAGLPGAVAAGGLGPGLGALGAGGLGPLGSGLGGMAGLGQAASVGALSVPSSWGWAAAGAPLQALAPAAVPLAASAGDIGAAGMIGAPMFLGGMPRAAALGAAAGTGAVAAKYGSRLTVMARPPAAGYSADPTSVPVTKYQYPAVDGYSMNGHTPAGYRAAIVYLPTNEDERATV